jgi:hypothetical protein
MYNQSNVRPETVNRVKQNHKKETNVIKSFQRAERIQLLEKNLLIIKASKKKGSPLLAVARPFRSNVLRRVAANN